MVVISVDWLIRLLFVYEYIVKLFGFVIFFHNSKYNDDYFSFWSWDPDMVTGYEIQLSSWGYLIERGTALGLDMLRLLSRLLKPGWKSHCGFLFVHWADIFHSDGSFFTSNIIPCLLLAFFSSSALEETNAERSGRVGGEKNVRNSPGWPDCPQSMETDEERSKVSSFLISTMHHYILYFILHWSTY